MVHDLAAISPGDTNAHAITSTRTPAQWVQIMVKSDNAGTVWVGGSTVAAGRGIPLAPAGFPSQFFPPIGDGSYLDLSQIYYKMTTGTDTIYVVYGVK